MDRTELYLRIPPWYGERLMAPLRWSTGGDAVVWPDGSTAVLSAEIALFLEGYAATGPLIPFAHLLHLALRLENRGHDDTSVSKYVPPRSDQWMRRASAWTARYRAAGRPTRNAGALCAWLCRDIPPAVDPPDPFEVELRLTHPSLQAMFAIRATTANAELEMVSGPIEDDIALPPPWDAERFESHFYEALGRMGDDEVDHWLRHGVGRPAPVVDAATDLPDAPSTAPADVDPFERWERLPRLGGVAAIRDQMVASLALPPRRLATEVLPTGGYADITTRGTLDRILPSQLVVDPDEFVRRYADRELLYFHREEPHAAVADALVVLLDQGVRCWGRVRLALAAAAIALGQRANHQRKPWQIGGTSTEGGLLDPHRADPATLDRFWEASDLSANPADALANLLDAPDPADPPVSRDVVVLTHPRSAAGPGFADAARGLGRGDLLFTVTADDAGRVELAEWRHGGPSVTRRFRVDLTVEPAPDAAPPAPADRTRWTGPVETVPYPFRLGLVDPIGHLLGADLIDFDHAGEHLAAATTEGTVHLWALDGSRSEILPRAIIGGEVVSIGVVAVVGVAGGFVVGVETAGKALAAVHYDLATRVARSYPLDPIRDVPAQWFYFRNLHALLIRSDQGTVVVELTTGEIRAVRPDEAPASSLLAFRAGRLAAAFAQPPPALAVVDATHRDPGRGGTIALDPKTGSILLDRVTPAWHEFTPMADGKPSLVGARVEQAQLRGDVLAVRVVGPDRKLPRLILFAGPDGSPIREYPPHLRTDSFRLSADGRWIAGRTGDRQVRVQPTTGAAAQTIFQTPKRNPNVELLVTLHPGGLVARSGQNVLVVLWGASGPLEYGKFPAALLDSNGVEARPIQRDSPLPAFLKSQENGRYTRWARSTLLAVVDRYGQISLFDRDDRLVAMLLVHRNQLAAWLPDGTRLGPPLMIDSPDRDSDDAALRIGTALRDASLRGRG